MHPPSRSVAAVRFASPGKSWIRWTCRMTIGGKRMSVRALILTVLLTATLPALAQETARQPTTNWPGYQEGDYVVGNYKFTSGENLPEVKLHYRTIGTAKRNAAGLVVNAVLLLQGNTGTGANWFRRVWPMNCSSRASRSSRRTITSSCPTLWAAAARRNLPMVRGPIPTLPIPRHGRPDAPAGHRRTEGRPFAADYWQLSGLHAAISVG